VHWGPYNGLANAGKSLLRDPVAFTVQPAVDPRRQPAAGRPVFSIVSERQLTSAAVVVARQRMPSQRGIDCRAAFLEASPIEKGGRGNFCNEQAQRSEHIYEA
jgi:hypothetical protein